MRSVGGVDVKCCQRQVSADFSTSRNVTSEANEQQLLSCLFRLAPLVTISFLSDLGTFMVLSPEGDFEAGFGVANF
ncbi:hypothetical protein E2C01_096319 [Portunus trituberculatus]|uniref:Uncharacterized protein n=1 Tax=Portunus trituberculatus TaxID=210409 RepID=A0A5B7K6K7_PORTR|nr:hypothetical protein [Portunus trituberculatus]